MNNRIIFAAMGAAVVILATAGLYLAFFSGDSGASGSPGSISIDRELLEVQDRKPAQR